MKKLKRKEYKTKGEKQREIDRNKKEKKWNEVEIIIWCVK